MEIPFFDFAKKEPAPPLTSGREGGDHLQAYLAALEELGEDNPKLKALLERLNEARAKFEQDFSRFAKTRDLLSAQRENEKARTAEAEGHRENMRQLIRDNSHSNDLHGPAGKIETALTMASEYRAYAEELELDLEAAELDMLDSAREQSGLFKEAYKAWATQQFEKEYAALLSDEKLILQRLVFLCVPIISDLNELFYDYTKSSLTNEKAAFEYLFKRMAQDVKPNIGEKKGEVYEFINKRANIQGEYTFNKAISPFSIVQRRKALATRRQQLKSGQSQTD